jgi:hypothetical protein
MTKYGLWVEHPGVWKGWLGFAAGDVFVPLAFDEDEACYRAARYMDARPMAMVSLRSDPPDELPWNEAEWKRATAA